MGCFSIFFDFEGVWHVLVLFSIRLDFWLVVWEMSDGRDLFVLEVFPVSEHSLRQLFKAIQERERFWQTSLAVYRTDPCQVVIFQRFLALFALFRQINQQILELLSIQFGSSNVFFSR